MFCFYIFSFCRILFIISLCNYLADEMNKYKSLLNNQVALFNNNNINNPNYNQSNLMFLKKIIFLKNIKN